ncbi:MAG: UDP-N-acetylglucosamine--N-acetylmuramyl-(pentapeptide) pyrophosphoryl-undecaprenol N-acetylglucosamine transferase [Planctomycetaceae bacterium]
MNTLSHVAFCGGGSGGHLSPAIAIAQELLQRDAEIRFTFLTSSRPIDRRVLEVSGLPGESFDHIALPLITSSGRTRYAVNAVRSFLKCRSQFLRCPPDVAIGTGGFASLPGVCAAHRLRIPIMLLELNTIPGAANRFLSRFAKVTCTGWNMDDCWQQRWTGQLCRVGVPIRREFCSGLSGKPDGHPDGRPLLLILGGSQGANFVNAMTTSAVAQSADGLRGWRIVHQAGGDGRVGVKEFYDRHSITADVVDFVDHVPQMLAEADIVISRCGAVTLAEIAAVGRASLLIPLASASDDHQTANAALFEAVNAAIIIREDRPDAQVDLAQQLQSLCASLTTRQRMATSALSLAPSNSAAVIADLLRRLLIE